MSSQPGIPTIHFSRILIELGRYIQGINLNRIIDGLEAEKILNSQFAQKLKDVNDEYEKSNIVINIMQGRQENDFKTFLNIVAAEKPDGKFYDTTKQFFSGFTMFPGYEQYATWPNGKSCNTGCLSKPINVKPPQQGRTWWDLNHIIKTHDSESRGQEEAGRTATNE